VPLLLGAILVLLALIALVPLSIVLRYRAGTSRRRARSWIVTLNFTGLVVSVAFFLTAAAVSNVWVPDAFTYATTGLATGGILGALGLGLTRWESPAGSLHYTPNRWLVLAITLVVAARIVYGFWRAWHAWRVGSDDGSWFAAAGVAGSIAAGAVVLGYYLVYWWGVGRRLTSGN
jgi:hypothetical protein